MIRAVETQSWHKPLPELLADLSVDDVPDLSISGIAVDSRDVRDGALFLATAGRQRHGLEFARQAWSGGAAAIAWEPRPGVRAPSADSGEIYIAVPNLGRRSGRIAARFFDHPSRAMPVVGVTGTNGKTTIVHLVSRASRLLGLSCGHMGTLGFGLLDPLTPSALTTPDVVTVHKRLAWLRQQGAERAAMEVSSHALDQGRVDAVAFDTAVFTNLSRDHLDYHPTLEAYGNVKRQLFETPDLRHAVVNIDDPWSARMLDALPVEVQLTAVCRRADVPARANAFLRARDVTLLDDGLHMVFEGSGGDGEIRSSLMGEFNASNLLEALGVLSGWGVPVAEAATALGAVPPPHGRMETFSAAGRPLLVVDYAHTPDALRSALTALRRHCRGMLWCVFGCGGDRDRGKRAEMAQAASRADRVIVTDDNPRHEDPETIVADILAGFGEDVDYRVQRDRRRAIEDAAGQAGAGDVVLIAGKGHEGFQIVGSQRLPLSDRQIVAELMESAP